MKKFLMAMLIALPFSAFAQKFAVVDVATVFTACPATTEAQTKLEAASKQYQEEYTKLQEEFQKSYAEFQALDESTPDAIKERRLKSLQDLNTRIEAFQTTAAQDLQRQQEELMAPIQTTIKEAIAEVGTAGGYTMVFDSTQPLFQSADVVDITDLVKAKVAK